MKIGILGAGNVGQTLGAGLAALDHEVKIGTRDPGSEKVRDWVARTGNKASAGTLAETATFADLAILATPWGATEQVIRLAGPNNLAGKVVIDVTNPLNFGPQGPTLALGHTTSGGEQVQSWLPQAHVVKAFNTIGAPLMINPSKTLGETPDMFICGNDDTAKKTVTSLLSDFGWPVIDMGSIEEARLLEPLAMIWIKYFFRTQTGTHAFKFIRK